MEFRLPALGEGIDSATVVGVLVKPGDAVSAGQNVVGPFYYQDARAGSALLTAATPGITSGTQTETILPGPVIGLSVKPSAATVGAGTPSTFAVLGVDSFGNSVPVTAAWSLDPPGLGKIEPARGTTASLFGDAAPVTPRALLLP